MFAIQQFIELIILMPRKYQIQILTGRASLRAAKNCLTCIMKPG